MTLKRKKKLKALAKLMNKQNERMLPVLPPLIQMLNLVLLDEELDFLLEVGTEAYTHRQLANLAEVTEDEFEDLFQSVCRKGFIRRVPTDSGEECFALNAILVGWVEAQIPYLMGKPEEREFAEKFYGEYVNYAKKFAFFPLRNLQNTILRSALRSNQSVGIVEASRGRDAKTVIDVNQPLSREESKVYPTKTVNALIEEYGNRNMIAQLPCMCRHSHKLLGDPCRFDMPDNGGCLMFGDSFELYVKYGHARPISKEEAFDVIKEVRDKGAIHSVFHEKDDTSLPEVGICNCCWDCCGLLRSYNYGGAALKYDCFYSARISNSGSCIGCGKCEKHCPTTAAKVVEKEVIIEESRCIGCGQCVHQCPETDVLELVPNSRTVFLPLLKKSEIRVRP